MVNCSLTDNSAVYGGGLSVQGAGASLALNASNLTNNSALSGGDGQVVAAGGCVFATQCGTVIINSSSRLSFCKVARALVPTTTHPLLPVLEILDLV